MKYKERTPKKKKKFPAEVRNVSLLHIVHTGPGVRPASYSVRLGVVHHGQSDGDVKLITHLPLALRLKNE
jgi:hypothetical protein